MADDIETKRAKLKSWMALHKMSRKALADHLGMSVTSINGWFSNANIPDKKWCKLKEFFEVDDTAPVEYKAVGFAAAADDVSRFNEAAQKMGMTLEEYLRYVVLKNTDELLGE